MFLLNRCRAPGCLIIKKIDRKSLSPWKIYPSRLRQFNNRNLDGEFLKKLLGWNSVLDPYNGFLNVLILFWRIGFTLQDEKRPKCIAFSDIFSSLFYFQFSIFSPLTIRASCHKLTQDKLVISWNLFFKRLYFWIMVIVSFFLIIMIIYFKS